MAAHFDRYYCGKCYTTMVCQDPKMREAGQKQKDAGGPSAQAAAAAPAAGGKGKKGKK